MPENMPEDYHKSAREIVFPPLRSARLLLGFNALAGVVGSELSRACRNSHAWAPLRSGNQRDERWLINPNDTISATIVYLPHYTVLLSSTQIGPMRLAAIESRET